MEIEDRSLRLDSQRMDVAMIRAEIKTDVMLAKKAGITGLTIRNIRKSGHCSFKVWGMIAAAVKLNPIDLIVTEGFADPKSDALGIQLN